MSTYIASTIKNDYVKMRWKEPYVTNGLNIKDFGIIRAGVYSGFVIGPNGINTKAIDIGPGFVSGGIGTGIVSGYAMASFDSTLGYSIAAQEMDGLTLTIQIPPGIDAITTIDLTGISAGRKYLVLQASYAINQNTAAQFAVVDGSDIDLNPRWLVLGYIDVPSGVTPIDVSMIGYDDPIYPRFTPLSTPSKSGYMPASAWNQLSGFAYGGLLQMAVSDISPSYVTISPSQKIVSGKRIYSYTRPAVASKFPRALNNKYNGGPNNDQLTYLNIFTGQISGAHKIAGNLNFATPSIIGSPNKFQIGLISINESDNVFVNYSAPLTTYDQTQDEDNMPILSNNHFQIGAFIASTDGSGTLNPLNPGTDIIWRLPYLNMGQGGSIVDSVQFYQEPLEGIYDGSNQTFYLSMVPKDANSLLLFLNGLPVPKNEYIVNGPQVVTLNVSPTLGQELTAFYVVDNANDFACWQEVPVGVVDGTNRLFQLTKNPQNIFGIYVFLNSQIVPATDFEMIQGTSNSWVQFKSGSQPTLGMQPYVFYVMKNGNSFEAGQEFATGPVDGSNRTFAISNIPVDNQSTMVFLDKIKVSNDKWYLVEDSETARIEFISGYAPIFPQDIYVTYFKQIKALQVIVNQGQGGVESFNVVGSFNSPVVVNEFSGLVINNEHRQYKYVVSTGGVKTIIATPQIAAGQFDGQELIIKGTSDVDYPIFTDGNGLSLNGSCMVKRNQTLYLLWNSDLSVWEEMSRRL